MNYIKRFLSALCAFCLCPFLALADVVSVEEDLYYPIGIATSEYRHLIEEGLWGYMDRSGRVVIEPKWSWAESFMGDVARVGDDDSCYLINRQGEIVLGPMPSIRRNIISYTVIDDQGRQGIYDIVSGKYIVSDYGDIYDQHSADPTSTRLLVIARDESCYGYLDRATGELAIPMQYDEMPRYQLSNTFMECLSSECSQAVFSEGYALVMTQKLDSNGVDSYLIDENGKHVLFPEGIQPLTRVQDELVIVRKTIETGEQGWPYFHVMYGLAKIEAGKAEVLAEPIYNDFRPIVNGYAAMYFIDVKNQSATLTFLDNEGKEVMPPVKSIAHEGGRPTVVDGYFYQNVDNKAESVLYHIDKGELLRVEGIWLYELDPAHDTIISDWDPLQILYTMDGHEKGRFACISPTYEPAWNYDREPEKSSLFLYEPGRITGGEYFSEGLQAVCVEDEDGMDSYGYINAAGKFVLEPQWSDAGNFFGGLAMVVRDNVMMYINCDGQIVWKEK